MLAPAMPIVGSCSSTSRRRWSTSGSARHASSSTMTRTRTTRSPGALIDRSALRPDPVDHMDLEILEGLFLKRLKESWHSSASMAVETRNDDGNPGCRAGGLDRHTHESFRPKYTGSAWVDENGLPEGSPSGRGARLRLIDEVQHGGRGNDRPLVAVFDEFDVAIHEEDIQTARDMIEFIAPRRADDVVHQRDLTLAQ